MKEETALAYWHTKSLTDHKHLDALFGAEQSVAKTLAENIGYDGTYSTAEKRLAELAGVAPGTVAKAILKLEHMGVISRHRAGRRSPTVYTWHSCTPGCVDPLHTGKKDTRASRHISGALAVDVEEKPLSRAQKRKRAKQKVAFTLAQRKEAKKANDDALSTSVSTSVDELSTSLFGADDALSTSVSGVLKDKQLKREEDTDPWRDDANPWLPSKPVYSFPSHEEQAKNLLAGIASVTGELSTSVAEENPLTNWLALDAHPSPPLTPEPITTPMTHYGALALDVKALADSHWADSLTAEVLLDLLTDTVTAETVCALAVELWNTPPQGAALTFEHVEQLRQHYETRTGNDTRGHYMAIHRYRQWAEAPKPWRALTQAEKDNWLKRYGYAVAVHMSGVARNVEMMPQGVTHYGEKVANPAASSPPMPQ